MNTLYPANMYRVVYCYKSFYYCVAAMCIPSRVDELIIIVSSRKKKTLFGLMQKGWKLQRMQKPVKIFSIFICLRKQYLYEIALHNTYGLWGRPMNRIHYSTCEWVSEWGVCVCVLLCNTIEPNGCMCV